MTPLTAPTMVIIDGKDIGELGFIVSAVDGWRDIPRSRKRSVQLVGRDGNIAIEPAAALSSRLITVRGTIQQDSFANLKSSVDELGGRLFNAAVARFVDNDDRFINARLETHSILPLAAQFTGTELDYSFTLIADDPIIYETALTNVTFTATKDNCPLGTYFSKGIITINGAVTNPSIIYRDSGSNIITQMDIVAVVAGGESIIIDLDNHTVSYEGSNIINDLTGPFIVLDPNDANDPYDPSPTWPTLECTPTASCEIDYQKAYVS